MDVWSSLPALTRCARPERPEALQQAQVGQLAPQYLRHFCRAGRGALEVARRIGHREVAPALEGAVRPRLDQHELAVEHEAAAPDAVAVDEGTHGQDLFQAHDGAAD